MKKLYSNIGLEFSVLLNVILSFFSYLIPVAFKVQVGHEIVPVYGFLLFGSLSIVCGLITVIAIIIKDKLPQIIQNIWQIFINIYTIFYLVNVIVSLFYAPITKMMFGSDTLTYKIGWGFLIQLVVFILLFSNIYHVYHEDYVLFKDSALFNFIQKNKDENN